MKTYITTHFLIATGSRGGGGCGGGGRSWKGRAIQLAAICGNLYDKVVDSYEAKSSLVMDRLNHYLDRISVSYR